MNASHSGNHIQIWSHGMTLYHGFMRHHFWTLFWRDEIVEVTAPVASLLYIRFQSKFITGCCFVSKNFDTLLPPANEVWGKVIFLHQSVSDSVHGGVSAWAPLPRQTPPGQTPPQADTSWADTLRQTTTPGRHLPGRQPLLQVDTPHPPRDGN